MAPYQYSGPIDCTTNIDKSNLKGGTAIVTGGANGIGEAYARALVAAGSIVVIDDLDVTAGNNLASEFPTQVHFLQCNVTSWEDQVRLFQEAANLSPTGKVHYVVANAGIIRPDEVFKYEADGRTAPELSTIDINIKGTLYTSKLAMHYLVKQNGTIPSETQEDTCLVLIGSGAGIHDCLRIPQYSATRWAMRSIIHSLRRTAHLYGSRVNVTHPWYVKTKIMAEEVFEDIKPKGVEFARVEDAGTCLLRIRGGESVNGYSFFIAARRWACSGFMDLGLEDTEEDELRREIQVNRIRGAPVGAGLFA